MTARSLTLATALVVLLGATSSPALAQETKEEKKKACADAYSQAQTLRDAHKLRDTRAQLRVCAQATCPGFIVKDCTEWLVDLERRMPSVVLSARDGRGQPLTKVSVTVDGARIAQSLDGDSIEVDPGLHTFVFVTADGARTELPFTVLEGQKAQAVTVTFPAPASTAAPVPPTPQPAAPSEGASTEASSPGGTQRTLAWVTGGVGLAGVVTGGIFGALAMSAASQQKTDCAGTASCNDYGKASTDHSNAVSDGRLSTIAFVAGGVLVATGAVLFFTSPSARTQVGLTMVPASSQGAGVLLSGAF